MIVEESKQRQRRKPGSILIGLILAGATTAAGAGPTQVAWRHVAAGYGPPHDTLVLDFGGVRRVDPGHLRAVSGRMAEAILYSNRGAERLQAGQDDAAVAWLESALRLEPSFQDAWVNLGVAFRRTGHLRGAEAAYRRALKLDPYGTPARRNLSLLRSRPGADGKNR